MKRKRCFLIVFVVLVVGLYGIKVCHKRGDLPVFLQGARNLWTGHQIYYDVPGAFTYPPFFALFVSPFALFPLPVATVLWYLFNVACILGCLLLLRNLILTRDAESKTVNPVLVIGLGFLFTVRFIFDAFENQQFDLVVFCATLLFLLFLSREKPVRSGFFMALAGSLKVTPLLFIVYLLFNRKVNVLAWTFVFLLTLNSVPEIFGLVRGRLYAAEWAEVILKRVNPASGGRPWASGGVWQSSSVFNQSLSAMFYRYFTDVPVEGMKYGSVRVNFASLDPGRIKLLTYLAYGILFAVTLFVSRPVNSIGGQAQLYEWSLFLLLMVLVSPISSKAHFVVLFLPNLLLWRERLLKKLPAALTVLFFLSFGLTTLTADGLIGRKLADLASAFSCVTLGTLVLWIAVVVRRYQMAGTGRTAGIAPMAI